MSNDFDPSKFNLEKVRVANISEVRLFIPFLNIDFGAGSSVFIEREKIEHPGTAELVAGGVIEISEIKVDEYLNAPTGKTGSGDDRPVAWDPSNSGLPKLAPLPPGVKR